MRVPRLIGSLALAGASVALAATPAAAKPAVRQLSGVVHLDPGSCHGGHPTGSYLTLTFGTRAIDNSSSSCGGGAYTLLKPRSSGLATDQYSLAATGVFDRGPLSVLTAQTGYAAPPRLYLVGRQVRADLRSAQVAYNGGQYSVGSEQASGSYDARSRQLSLDWFSGQSFTADSAGTQVHLEGQFDGSSTRVPAGTQVDLGTASFQAGSATQVSQRTGGRPAHQASASHRSGYGRIIAGPRQVDDEGSTTTGSPKTFLIAEVLVLANLVAFVTLARRRRA